MKSRKKLMLTVIVASIGMLWACSTVLKGYAPPQRHPEMEGEDLRYCTACHESGEGPVRFENFEHSTFFAENHGPAARRYEGVCAMCHRANFCSDCHGVGVELKPSLRHATENYRRMPHRGDYLSRHQIDGRINPTSCYRCHGNPKTTQTCKPCHG